jgi:hypothetical protein
MLMAVVVVLVVPAVLAVRVVVQAVQDKLVMLMEDYLLISILVELVALLLKQTILEVAEPPVLTEE